jgi:hypothetical protein
MNLKNIKYFVIAGFLLITAFYISQLVGNFQKNGMIRSLEIDLEQQIDGLNDLGRLNDSLVNHLELFRDTVGFYQNRNMDLYHENRKLKRDFKNQAVAYERKMDVLLKSYSEERIILLKQKNNIIYEN